MKAFCGVIQFCPVIGCWEASHKVRERRGVRKSDTHKDEQKKIDSQWAKMYLISYGYVSAPAKQPSTWRGPQQQP